MEPERENVVYVQLLDDPNAPDILMTYFKIMAVVIPAGFLIILTLMGMARFSQP
jgi:hypothetical protein